MTTIATLAVKLIADAAGFLSAMDQAETKSKTWSANVSKNLQEVGGKMTDFGQKATMGLTLPIMGAGLAAINYASDLEETKNKINVVFGSMSKDVLAWSENSATAMGLSREQALAAAGTYGNLFVSLGLGEKPAADMSMSLVGLASDLSSFNNANPQEVLDALRSGLSGEVEPLKKYGVAMNEVIMKQMMMEMGLGDNIQALTEAEKLQVRYAIIMEQTATAQGDFSRTADGLANQQKILKAQFVDVAAALGQKLLPYALQFVQWVGGLIEKFQALTPEQQNWIMILVGVAAGMGPVVMVIGTLVTAIGAIIPVVTAVGGVLSGFALPILLIIGVLALLYFAWTNNWGGIQEKVAVFWAWLQPILQNLWNWLAVNVPLALQTLQSWWNIAITALSNLWTNVLQPAIAAVWDWMSGTVFPFWMAVADFLSAVFGVALTALAGIWQNVLAPALQTAYQWLSEKLSPAFQWLADFWNSTLQPVVAAISEWIGTNLVNAFEWLSGKISSVTDWLSTMADTLRNMSLPDWMTPGSPTPWEIGLRGVGSALDMLTRTKLPTFGTALELSPVPAFAGAGASSMMTGGGGSGAGGGVVMNVNVVSDGVTDEKDVARKIWSAVEVILRERGLV